MRNIMNWYDRNLEGAEFNRLGVMAFILLVQTCILIPATVLITSNSAIYPIALATAAIFSFAILVCMIAGLRVKITLPIFAVNVLVLAALITIA